MTLVSEAGEGVPSRPRSRLMNACSGTKLATARIRLRSLSADDVQWVLQEHLPDHVELCVGSDTHASDEILPFRPSVLPFTQKQHTPTLTKSLYYLKIHLFLEHSYKFWPIKLWNLPKSRKQIDKAICNLYTEDSDETRFKVRDGGNNRWQAFEMWQE